MRVDPMVASARGTQPRYASAVLAGLSLLVLGCTLLLGVLLVVQSQSLTRSVEESRTFVEANLSAFTQARREILRLMITLAAGQMDEAELDRQRGLIDQYSAEATQPGQVFTLGSEALLAESQALRREWTEQIEPLIREWASSPDAGTEAVRLRALAALDVLEQRYNQLATEAESNLRQHGVALAESARATLDATALLLAVLLVSAAGLVGLGAMTAHGYRRLGRQRTASAQALLEANAELRKLSALASLTRNQVVVTDAAGAIEWVNQAFIEKTGYTLEEVRGQRPGAMLQGAASDPSAIATMRTQVQAGAAFETELINYAKDGREYWVAIEARPIFDEHGQVTSFIAIQTDITARKQTEAALRTALEQERELREMKSRFVSTTSHEFRTPLTAILSMASYLIMAEGTISAEKRADRLAKIEAAARHIAALIDDVLLFEQTDTAWLRYAPEEVDVLQVLREVLDELRAGAGARHTFHWDWPNEPVRLQADRKLLRQILSNVLSNAVKYSAPGSPVEVRVQRDMGRVCVHVRDYGVGIPAAEQKHVFDPFYRATNTGGVAGTGLGLPITRNAVELHGGQLLFESIEGEGTTFTVLLPAEPVPEIPS